MKCFYHNDMDGRGAAFVVSKFTQDRNKENYFEVDYNMDLMPIIEKIDMSETVYFVDYSITKESSKYVRALKAKNCNVIWIDHHKSSIEAQEEDDMLRLLYGWRTSDYSGAVLTYMYLFDIDYIGLPKYIKLVDDYDRWIYDFGKATDYFKLGLESMPFDALDEIWQVLDEDSKKDNVELNKVIDKGRIIKGYVDATNKYYRDHYSYETMIANHKCLVVNQRSNSWIFGDKIQEYPIVMTWVYDGKKYTYSIFTTRDDIDCSEIAALYGGGGHKKAAGFSSDVLIAIGKDKE